MRVLYDAAERCATAVNLVNVSRGKTTKEEFDRVWALKDEARDARTAARLALEQHKKEHGC